jgi:integrase
LLRKTVELPPTERGLATWIANVRGGDRRQWIPIGRGLVLCIEPSGLKSFQARFRLKGSKQAKRMHLGYHPKMSLSDARAALETVRSAARSGEDPSLARKRDSGAISTLDDLAEEYLKRREGKIAPKTLRVERGQLAIIRAKLGSRRLVDLEPRDVSQVIEDYAADLRKEGQPGTNANKVLAVTKRMFSMSRGWGLVNGSNPASDLRRPVKERPRERVLFDGEVLVDPARPKLNELGQFVAALQADPSPIPASRPTRIAILLSLLLGFRASEVCGLEWTNIDLGDEPTVTVAKSKTDAGRRTLPLSPLAVDLLRELKPKAGRGRYVFPAAEGAGRAATLHAESLSRAVTRAAEKLKLDKLVHHDLRRTCITGLGELGFDGIAPRIAGHQSKTVTGRHYDHSRRMNAMREAVCRWGTIVAARGSSV